VTIRNQPAEHAATLRIWTEAGTRHYSGSSGEWPGNLPQYNINCQGQTMQQVLFGALGFFATDSDNDVLPPGALSFGGKFTNQPQAGNTVEHSYSFRCASGC
jgi:hypothetical protein